MRAWADSHLHIINPSAPNLVPVTPHIAALLAAPPKGYWLNDLPKLRVALAGGPAPSREDLLAVADRLKGELKKGNAGRATNWMALGFLLGVEKFWQRLLRDGILRASKYSYTAAAVAQMIGKVIAAAGDLDITENILSRLHSIRNLLRAAPGMGRIDHEVRRNVALIGPRGIRTLLTTVDWLFMRPFETRYRGDVTEWDNHSVEQLVEAFSYCFFIHMEAHGPDERVVTYPPDADAVVNGTLLPLLHQAALVRQYREWEVLLEAAPYVCEPGARANTIVIRGETPRIEMAYAFGNIRTDMAKANVAARVEETALLGEEKVAAALYRLSKRTGLLRIEEQPLRRVVLEIPAVPQLLDWLQQKAALQEEAAYIQHAERQYLLNAGTLLERHVVDDLTPWDLLRVRRILNLFRMAAAHEIERLAETDPEAAARSLVPAFTDETLTRLLEAATGNREKARTIIERLSWSPEDGIFDLQFYPFVRAGQMYAIPLNVAGQSDILRNTFFLYDTDLKEPDGRDPAEAQLHAAFAARGIPARKGREYAFAGKAGEFDVIAAWDGRVFVFECKTVYLPVNAYDLRRTLKEMDSAVDQLNRILEVSGEQGFHEYTSRITGLDIQPGQPIITSIVLTNRMFAGLMYKGHPVLSLHELMNYIRTGAIAVLGQQCRLVEGDAVAADDLEDYLRNLPMHQKVFDAMVPLERAFTMGNVRVVSEHYALRTDRLAEAFGVPVPEELSAEAARLDAEADCGNEGAIFQNSTTGD